MEESIAVLKRELSGMLQHADFNRDLYDRHAELARERNGRQLQVQCIQLANAHRGYAEWIRHTAERVGIPLD